MWSWVPRIVVSVVAISAILLAVGNRLIPEQPSSNHQNATFLALVVAGALIAVFAFWLQWRRARMNKYVAARLSSWASVRIHGPGAFVTLRAAGNALMLTAVILVVGHFVGFGVISPEQDASQAIERVVKLAAFCAVPSVLWAIEEWRQWEKRYNEHARES